MSSSYVTRRQSEYNAVFQCKSWQELESLSRKNKQIAIVFSSFSQFSKSPVYHQDRNVAWQDYRRLYAQNRAIHSEVSRENSVFHVDTCLRCHKGGQLLVCSRIGCSCSYHFACLNQKFCATTIAQIADSWTCEAECETRCHRTLKRSNKKPPFCQSVNDGGDDDDDDDITTLVSKRHRGNQQQPVHTTAIVNSPLLTIITPVMTSGLLPALTPHGPDTIRMRMIPESEHARLQQGYDAYNRILNLGHTPRMQLLLEQQRIDISDQELSREHQDQSKLHCYEMIFQYMRTHLGVTQQNQHIYSAVYLDAKSMFFSKAIREWFPNMSLYVPNPQDELEETNKRMGYNVICFKQFLNTFLCYPPAGIKPIILFWADYNCSWKGSKADVNSTKENPQRDLSMYLIQGKRLLPRVSGMGLTVSLRDNRITKEQVISGLNVKIARYGYEASHQYVFYYPITMMFVLTILTKIDV